MGAQDSVFSAMDRKLRDNDGIGFGKTGEQDLGTSSPLQLRYHPVFKVLFWETQMKRNQQGENVIKAS